MTVYLKTIKTQSNNSKTILKKHKKRRSFGYSQIISFLLAVVGISIISYVIIINKVATMGYDMGAVKSELIANKNKNSSLNIKLSELQSITLLQKKAITMKMSKPVEINYINTKDSLAWGKR